MGVVDIMRGQLRKSFTKRYKVGDKVRIVSFHHKASNGAMVFLDVNEMSTLFRKRAIRCADVVTNTAYIEITDETYRGENEIVYTAKIVDDAVLLIEYTNVFSHDVKIKKTWFWYPNCLSGYYIDLDYAAKLVTLLPNFPKKFIDRIKRL